MILHKNTCEIARISVIFFQSHTVCINGVILIPSDVWVNNHHDSTVACLNVLIHLHNLSFRKIFGIKLEVLVKTRIVLIRVINIHPKNIDWEITFSEITVTIDHYLSTNAVPFTKMETKRVNWR